MPLPGFRVYNSLILIWSRDDLGHWKLDSFDESRGLLSQ
jgi:hypothetical protein